MADLTVEDLIKKAKRRKIDLGADPEKTIRICIRRGLIPKPKRKKIHKRARKTVSVFPESTLDILKHIKTLKSEGLSLEEIRETFALEYVQTALRDLLSEADDEKVGQLADILGSKERDLESIVQAPLIYVIEGMSPDEAKKLLTLFCGVGFYALLEAQQALEELSIDDCRRALSKAIFYNSVAVLRLARTTGDTKLEATASGVYEKVVLEPIRKASERVRKEFKKSIDLYLQEKGL